MSNLSNLLKISILISLVLNFAFSQNTNPANVIIKSDTIILKGKMYHAEAGEKIPTILLLHGFPGNENDVLGMGSKLSQEGYNVLTFNYSGTFQSGGEWSFEHTQKDIQTALDFLYSDENIKSFKIDTSQIYLGGYSFGGGMSLTYAANHPRVKTVFSIAGTDHGEFMREYFRNAQFRSRIDQMFEKLKYPTGPVKFAKGTMPREATPSVFTVADSAIDLRKSASLLKNRNILLIAGWDDPNVTLENHVLPLYRALQNEQAENVKIVAFQDNHSFKKNLDELANTIIEWLRDLE